MVPGVSADFESGTDFHTTVSLRPEDFQSAAGTMIAAQAGAYFTGYGAGYAQIAGTYDGRRWVAVSDDEGLLQGTTFIWIGGVQTANIGADAGAHSGIWTFDRLTDTLTGYHT